MSSMWLGSYIVLWFLVILLSFAFLALSRQIGLLYGRLPEVGARMQSPGPELGQKLEPTAGLDLWGRNVEFPSPDGKHTLLSFAAPGCSMCAQVLPGLSALAKQEKKNLNVVIVGINGDQESNRAYAEHHKITHIPYIVWEGFAARLRLQNAPYAVLLDDLGIVRAKGLVNNREHLDSLLNAADTGYESIDHYSKVTVGTR